METYFKYLYPEKEKIPAAYRPDAPYVVDRLLMGGSFRKWEGAMEEVTSPIRVRHLGETESVVLGRYPLMGTGEAMEALEAAKAAYGGGAGEWPTLSVEKRIAGVLEFIRLMKERREEVVKILLWQIAKSLPDATKEFDRTIDYMEQTVEALKELDRKSSRFRLEQGIAGQIRRAPLGVTLCIGPSNYPLNETLTLLIPALIMGNTVLFKPPHAGVLVFAPLLDAFKEAFPAGVVNVLFGRGDEVVTPLMETGEVAALAFIGSSKVADKLEKRHPKSHRLRSVLGLEAKNAAIILPDADLEESAKEALLGSLSYNGQRCTALKILFVHRTMADRFLGRLAALMEEKKARMPWEEGAFITPLPDEGKVDYMKELVEDAKAKGAEVVNPSGGVGYETLFSPALVYPVDASMRLWHEEQFGPVVPVAVYDDLEEPLKYVADSPYGQQVSLFGTDPELLARLIDPLTNQVSRVNINSQCQRGPDTFPFTGRKDSAQGTLSVEDALRAFSIRSLVAAKTTGMNKEILTQIIRERKSAFLNTDFIF